METTTPSEASFACQDWHLTAEHCSSSSSSLGPALERDRPDDHLVVDGRQGGADEGADPEDPLQSRKEGLGGPRSEFFSG